MRTLLLKVHHGHGDFQVVFFRLHKKKERSRYTVNRPTMFYDNTLRTYTLSRPNFTQRRQWANPRSLILNIEGATDHYRLSISEILEKLYVPVIGKNAMLYDKTPRTYASSRSNLPQEDNGPISVLWYWILKELQTIIG